MIGAALLSEYVTPWAEIKSGEANLLFRGKAGGDRLKSGYWFKEPTANGGTRIINIGELKGDGQVANITLYEFKKDLTLSVLSTAPTGLLRGAGQRPPAEEPARRRREGARAHGGHHAQRRAPAGPRADP
ncbi:hypothetical protein G6F64_013751 [Rhizopus arrhizus]|uniref:Uncharacterized protein n=1 Tax=Rhizopus oryzae TaxID=64495 RepID=A0A9P6WUR2_RHIOR|nr:hypothetical protein G6F64_013751 [Rhizopus arrhizus]